MTNATIGDFDIEFAYDTKCDIGTCSEQPCYRVNADEGKGFHVCLHHLNALGRELAAFCNTSFGRKSRR